MKDKAKTLVIALAVGWTPPAAAEIPDIGPFVEGRIRSVDGAGLSDVTVEIVPRLTPYEDDLRRFQGQPPPGAVATTGTGSDGSFLIPLPFPAPWSVVARADGFLAMQYPMVFTEESVSLPPVVLPPAEPIHVEVVDAEGRPVSGARVLARDEDFSDLTWIHLPAWSAVLEDGVTDADGVALRYRTPGKRLRLRAWTPDRFGVATAEGEARSVQIAVVPGQEMQVVVRADEHLRRGILVLLDGIPLALTGPEGRASMLGPPEDEHPPSFRHPMDWLMPKAIPRPDNRHFTGLDLGRFPSTSLEARLLDAATGEGIAGAWVWFDNLPLHFDRTDSTGRYATVVIGGEVHFAARSYFPASYRLDEEELTSGRIPDVSLQPASAAIGIAVDTSGGPVAAARLILQLRSGPPGSALPRKLRHDLRTMADGRFSFPHLVPNGEYGLIVEKEGFADAELVFTAAPPAPAPPRTLEVVMRPGCTLSGVAADERGAPVSGAKIRAIRVRWGSRVDLLAPKGRQVTATATSDAQGRFQLADLTPGGVGLEISADGYLDQSVPGLDLTGCTTRVELGEIVLAAGAKLSGQVTDQQGRPLEGVIRDHPVGSEVDQIPHPAASVEGTVLDARGQPVAHASISLVAKSQDAPFGSTRSGDDGRYHLPGLPPGPQSIELKRFLNGRRIAVRDIVLEPGKNLLDFALEPDSVVSGRVRDEEGRPVVGATVDLVPAGTGGRTYLTAITADDGTFGIQGVPRGRYSVGLRREGFPFVRIEERVRVLTAGAEVSGIEVVLPHGGSIAGAVHGLSDAEISSLSVTAIDQAHMLFTIRAQLETGGFFRIPGLRPGSWLVLAEVDRRSIAVTAVVRSGDETRLDLDFAGGLQLRGQILRSAEPVPDLQLELVSLEKGAGFSTSTAEDGRFQLAGLEPGSYRLDYRRGYRQQILRRRLELDDDLDLRVDLDALETRVSGTIVDESSGRPLSGVDFCLESLESDDFPTGGSSDEDGHFLLSGVRAGSYILRAGKDGYSPLAIRLELREGEPVTSLELELAPVAGLPLEIRWAGGEAPASVHVIVLDAAGRWVGQEGHNLGQDGRFEVRQAPRQGGWLLVRAKGAATVRLPITAPTGEIHPLLLEPEAILEISTPAIRGPRHRVTLKDDQGKPYFLGYTGDLSIGGLDKIRIDGLPAGTWTVVVESVDGPVWSESVTTRPGQVTALDLK